MLLNLSFYQELDTQKYFVTFCLTQQNTVEKYINVNAGRQLPKCPEEHFYFLLFRFGDLLGILVVLFTSINFVSYVSSEILEEK